VLKGDNGTCGHGVRTASQNVKVGQGDGFDENPETGYLNSGVTEPDFEMLG
jgi:hypothetical protein